MDALRVRMEGEVGEDRVCVVCSVESQVQKTRHVDNLFLQGIILV